MDYALVLLFTVILLTASVPKDAYAHREFGKFSDWSEPVNLGPTINTNANDRLAALTNDGLRLYFASDRDGGFGGYDLYVSRRLTVEDPWGSPQNLGPTVNTQDNERAPSLSTDGHWLYLNSDKPGYCGGFDIFVSWRGDTEDDFAWQIPVNLGCTINTQYDEGGEMYFQDPNTGLVTLFYNSQRPDGVGPPDIYTSNQRPDGSFGRPALVWELCTPVEDGHASLRLDGLEVFLFSNRPGSIGGVNNIWTSIRETTLDAWSPPVNLGPVVNSGMRDSEPTLSPDGTELYYSSLRTDGLGGWDLWVTRRERLKQ